MYNSVNSLECYTCTDCASFNSNGKDVFKTICGKDAVGCSVCTCILFKLIINVGKCVAYT